MTGRAGLTALAVAVFLVATVPAQAQAQAQAQAPMRAPAVEYIDIRWDGVEKLCVIYGDGRVEFLGEELKNIPRPDRVNGRAYYMTMAMQRMAARGYEVVAAFSDEIIMKKAMN
jgi:hypothetical protein